MSRSRLYMSQQVARRPVAFDTTGLHPNFKALRADRRLIALTGAFAAGILCQSMLMTTAGTVCAACVAFFVGMIGRRLLNGWARDGER